MTSVSFLWDIEEAELGCSAQSNSVNLSVLQSPIGRTRRIIIALT